MSNNHDDFPFESPFDELVQKKKDAHNTDGEIIKRVVPKKKARAQTRVTPQEKTEGTARGTSLDGVGRLYLNFKSFNIRSGYLLKSVEHLPPGEIHIFQMKDIPSNENLDFDQLTTMDASRVVNLEKHLLGENDVIFVSRGTFKRAIPFRSLVPEEQNVPYVIAAKPLIIISIKQDAIPIFPEYLAWYINQPISQNFLSKMSTGSNQEIVSATTLRKLPLLVPSIEVQEQIIDAHQLMKKAEKIQQQLTLEQNKLFIRLLDEKAKQ